MMRQAGARGNAYGREWVRVGAVFACTRVLNWYVTESVEYAPSQAARG